CRERARALSGGNVAVEAAYEGLEIELPEGKGRSEAPALATSDQPGLAKRILIADDSPLLLSQLEDLLRQDHYDVVRARDGEEAIARTLAQHPDMLILDVMVPKLDGFAVCQALRARAETRDLPILILTALENPEDTQRGFQV